MTEPCSKVSTPAGFSRRRPGRSLGLVGTAILSATAFAACGTDTPTEVCEDVEARVEDATFAPALNVTLSNMTMQADIFIEDLVIGTGPVAEAGDAVNVNYTGWLTDGSQFDAGTYPFLLGLDNVIIGWHQGIDGMQVGGKRLLVIPPSAAYGLCTSRGIPANSILVFEVELIAHAPAT